MEKEEIDACHPAAVALMKAFLQEIPNLPLGRALDVAAGFGRVTEDFLLYRYKEIDVFDPLPDTYNALCELRKEHGQIKWVDKETMQNYNWREEYDGVYLNWCAGYLSNGELVQFLRRAKDSLRKPAERRTRRAASGYIFVFDSVLDPVDEEEHDQHNQRVRW